MLRWLKTVVVSDVEKAHVMRQVGIGKTVRTRKAAGCWQCITRQYPRLFAHWAWVCGSWWTG